MKRVEQDQEDQRCLAAYRKTKDPALQEKLLKRFEPICQQVVRRYCAYCDVSNKEHTEDFLVEVRLGVVRALATFNEKKRVRLSTWCYQKAESRVRTVISQYGRIKEDNVSERFTGEKEFHDAVDRYEGSIRRDEEEDLEVTSYRVRSSEFSFTPLPRPTVPLRYDPKQDIEDEEINWDDEIDDPFLDADDYRPPSPPPIWFSSFEYARRECKTRKLPWQLRRPCEMHLLEGMTQQEIAQKLGVSQKTISIRLKKAKVMIDTNSFPPKEAAPLEPHSIDEHIRRIIDEKQATLLETPLMQNEAFLEQLHCHRISQWTFCRRVMTELRFALYKHWRDLSSLDVERLFRDAVMHQVHHLQARGIVQLIASPIK